MNIPIGILAGLTILNSLTSFLMFGWDKYRAIKQQFRVRERTLLLSGLPIGVLGYAAWNAYFSAIKRRSANSNAGFTS